jgi:hypothetical protein
VNPRRRRVRLVRSTSDTCRFSVRATEPLAGASDEECKAAAPRERVSCSPNYLDSVTRNEPDTSLRDQNEPVCVRISAYTRSMKTAEIRGIPPQLRGSGTAETPIICSWFESRYPSSNRRRIPRRNSPSPLLPGPKRVEMPDMTPDTPLMGTGMSHGPDEYGPVPAHAGASRQSPHIFWVWTRQRRSPRRFSPSTSSPSFSDSTASEISAMSPESATGPSPRSRT